MINKCSVKTVFSSIFPRHIIPSSSHQILQHLVSAPRLTHACNPPHGCSRRLLHGGEHLPATCPLLQLLNMARGALRAAAQAFLLLVPSGRKGCCFPLYFSLDSLPVVGHSYVTWQRTRLDFFHFK